MIIFALAFVLIDGSVLAVFSIVFSLWHELWHILVLKHYNQGFGFFAKSVGFKISTGALLYKQELLVCAAGPLASLVTALLFLPFCFKNEYAMFGFFSNAALFFVNIIPIYPLDGGRVLYSFLCQRLSLDTATKITRWVTVIFLLPLLIISVIIFVKTGYNLSLLMISFYLLALFVGVKNI